jgi:hypothetical protein
MSETNFSIRDTSLMTRGKEMFTFPVLKNIFKMLECRGWEIQTDQRIQKDYGKSFAKDYWEGKKGDLLFKAHRYPAGMELEFYQEVNIKHSKSGYYDFDKLKMMPYLIRCQFQVEVKHIKKLLIEAGFEDTTEPNFKYALDEVMFRIKDSCHYKEGKELPEYEIASYNATDKDKKQLRNGQIKYFRDSKGRLQRGVVYHNINNMWWVVLNKFNFTNVAAFELFDISAEQLSKKRVQSKVIPQRIRAQKLREKYKSLGLSYEKLNEEHIQMLRIFLTKEFEVFGSDMKLKLSTPRKKDIKVLKRTGLQYAVIQVDGYYFSRREAITFNSDGFIGFAGWACDYNTKPFVSAFDKWLEWLIETDEIAA